MAVGAKPRIWDTCSYVRRFGDRAVDAWIADDLRHRRFLLCSVVVMELYAGARDVRAKRALDDLASSLGTLGLIVSPDAADFQAVGVALNRYRRRKGAIDPRAHFRDALIASCAIRRGAEVVTENLRDLSRWGEWLRPARPMRVLRPEALGISPR